MSTAPRRILVCSCDKSMALDEAALSAADPEAAVTRCNYLCRADAATFVSQLQDTHKDGGQLLVACEQEAATFEELALDGDLEPDFTVVDIRDRAGWSDEGDQTGPKMSALLAEATLQPPATPTMDITSEGVCLVYGASEVALGAAERLNDHLSVTCILTDVENVDLVSRSDVPVFRGEITRASGSFGGFNVVVDRFAELRPGGRGAPEFGELRDGAKSNCDVIVDLSGKPAMFPAQEKRDGYHRADPASPAAVESVLFDASHMSGTFEKPFYIRFEAALCAHQRAQQPGCNRCLNVCPTGAITVPNGGKSDHVALDSNVCAGCGSCAAVCPSGAALADDPPLSHHLKRIQVLADVYRKAGGKKQPRLLIHDASHGRDMIALAARYGRGLPGDVIPFVVEETGGIGHTLLVAGLANGFCSIAVLAGPKSDRTMLSDQIALADALAAGVGNGGRISLLEVAEPDALSDALYGAEGPEIVREPVLLLGEGRDVVRLSLQALAGADIAQPFALPAGAPYGAIRVDRDACTLCSWRVRSRWPSFWWSGPA